MKRILLVTILLFAIKSFGQQDENPYLKSAKADFEKLSTDYETKEKEVKTGQTELNELLEKVKNDPKSKYSEELTKKVKEVEEQKKGLNSFCSKYENYKAFYLDKGVTINQINDFFTHKCTVNNEQEVSPKKEYKTYLYYGDDLIIEELKPTGDKKTDDILKKVLSAESNSYLGDIIIPMEAQKFYFYKTQKKISKKDFSSKKRKEIVQDTINIDGFKYLKVKKIPKDTIDVKGVKYFRKGKTLKDTINIGGIKYKKFSKTLKDTIKIKDTLYVKIKDDKKDTRKISKSGVIRLDEKYKFKRISFEICDGFFTDIKVFVLDSTGSEHLFENHYPVSVLDYSDVASSFYLFYKHPVNQVSSVKYGYFEDFRVRLSDVLVYVSKPGYNYIPNDVTFDLPTKDENGQSLNKYQAVKYEIKENTTLQNVIELRAYTDFLGLFSDSANGLVQLQGKGDFYMFPRLTPFRWGDFRVLDKISPYVNFSRIDADLREVETKQDNQSTDITVKNSLDLLQKAYLEMGTKINVINWRFSKELPFRVITYFSARYQISDVKVDETIENVKGLGLGGGMCFEFKRFNNFGFNYSLELSKYNFRAFNSIENFMPPSAFWVFRNEAEVFYFPDSNKKQAIFLRLKTFNNSSKDNNEAFYQLQFGYRFSIGISEVKAKAQ